MSLLLFDLLLSLRAVDTDGSHWLLVYVLNQYLHHFRLLLQCISLELTLGPLRLTLNFLNTTLITNTKIILKKITLMKLTLKVLKKMKEHHINIDLMTDILSTISKQ